jgi:hypothetical protein
MYNNDVSYDYSDYSSEFKSQPMTPNHHQAVEDLRVKARQYI